MSELRQTRYRELERVAEMLLLIDVTELEKLPNAIAKMKIAAKAALEFREIARNPDIAHAQQMATAGLQEKSRQFRASVKPIIKEIQESGLTTLSAITDELNRREVKAFRGGTWTKGALAKFVE